MHYSRPDNYSDPEQIPEGIQFRKEMVWDQLASKLDKKKKSTVLSKLSIAASLVLLIATGWLLTAGETQLSSASLPLKKIPSSIAKENSPSEQVVNQQPSVAVESKQAKQQLVKTTPSNKTSPEPEYKAPAEVYIVPQAPATVEVKTEIVATPAPARRFRIAHSNELGITPPEPKQKDVARIFPRRFQENYSVPEINQQPPPVKQKSLLGLLSNHQ